MQCSSLNYSSEKKKDGQASFDRLRTRKAPACFFGKFQRGDEGARGIMDNSVVVFRTEFKRNLIEWLQIENKTPEDMHDDEPLFGNGLGLDSLDAVEIVIMLQRKYNIHQKDIDTRREVFATLATLSDYVQEKIGR
jgi:acyl carrier protein